MTDKNRRAALAVAAIVYLALIARCISGLAAAIRGECVGVVFGSSREPTCGNGGTILAILQAIVFIIVVPGLVVWLIKRYAPTANNNKGKK